MSTAELLDGIGEIVAETPRLSTRVLHAGPLDGLPVAFVHGNLSTARFFEEILAALDPAWRGVAPDLRGFGGAQGLPVDATRGVREFSDDLAAVLDDPSVVDPERPVHLVGWSLGGGVVMQYAIDHPARVASVVLLASMSPFGFGGTRDVAGTPCWDDFAGSGGGAVARELVERLAGGDRSAESPCSPRQVMRSSYVKSPSCLSPHREDVLVDELLATALGDEHYPGSAVRSSHWPGMAPGTRGVNNTFSPRYCDLTAFADISPQPDVLWVHGDDDQIVSDSSTFDFGFLGRAGIVPDWPGEQFPPQPMVSQLRVMLERYGSAGGHVLEERFADCGHSPHLEHPERFRALLGDFVAAVERARHR